MIGDHPTVGGLAAGRPDLSSFARMSSVQRECVAVRLTISFDLGHAEEKFF